MHLYTVPEDFDYNAQTGKRGDRGMRMEIKRSSVEYIASSEYMVRHTLLPCTVRFSGPMKSCKVQTLEKEHVRACVEG